MFKVADKVICVDNYCAHRHLCIGEKYTIRAIDINKGLFINGHWWDTCRFKLVEEKPQFDLKKNPWFIRVRNKEEYELIQNWLKVNFGCCVNCEYHTGISVVTNVSVGGTFYESCAMWSHCTRVDRKFKCHEIVLEFETIVKSVKYPRVMTEQDKKIQ